MYVLHICIYWLSWNGNKRSIIQAACLGYSFFILVLVIYIYVKHMINQRPPPTHDFCGTYVFVHVYNENDDGDTSNYVCGITTMTTPTHSSQLYMFSYRLYSVRLCVCVCVHAY